MIYIQLSTLDHHISKMSYIYFIMSLICKEKSECIIF